jgi:hypothetical protein
MTLGARQRGFTNNLFLTLNQLKAGFNLNQKIIK